MKCGRNQSGSQWYSLFNGKVYLTLFPHDGDSVEISLRIFKFYKVFNFMPKQNLEK